MLRRVLLSVSKSVRKVMAENAIAPPVSSVDTGDKRPLKDEETATPPAKKAKVQRPNAPPMQGRADRKRKVALLIAYCGAGYYGIQIQMKGDFQTIESEMLKALVKAEVVPQEHADTPQKMSLQRAARTDKNVSAVGNVLSLKMLYQEGVADKINSHLPPQIRVIGCVRTTNGFDSKNHCTARTYKYMLPTYSFAPVEKFLTKEYRLPEGGLQRVDEVLGKFVGTHNFHNFTSGRKPNDPSSKRYIMSFQAGETFVRDGIEFVVLTVKGQSFMLHHIRKMIGLAIAIVRGHCGEDALTKSWGPLKMDIPKAPGVGLFLHELFFAGYNKKFGNDGMHEPLVWDKYRESLDKFKEEHVLSHIAQAELNESVMLMWLGTLQFHKFDVINPAEEVPPDGEKEKHHNWWKTKALLKKLDHTQKEEEGASSKASTDQGGSENEAVTSSEGTTLTSCTEGEEKTNTSSNSVTTEPPPPPPQQQHDTTTAATSADTGSCEKKSAVVADADNSCEEVKSATSEAESGGGKEGAV